MKQRQNIASKSKAISTSSDLDALFWHPNRDNEYLPRAFIIVLSITYLLTYNRKARTEPFATYVYVDMRQYDFHRKRNLSTYETPSLRNR